VRCGHQNVGCEVEFGVGVVIFVVSGERRVVVEETVVAIFYAFLWPVALAVVVAIVVLCTDYDGYRNLASCEGIPVAAGGLSDRSIRRNEVDVH
jgi:bacteriorhodopsin